MRSPTRLNLLWGSVLHWGSKIQEDLSESAGKELAEGMEVWAELYVHRPSQPVPENTGTGV